MSDSILVVEEDDTLRELLQNWLKIVFHRYEIVGARDEDKAIFLAEAESPRVILLDVGLAEMEGVETIRCLKAAVPSAEVVALAMDNYTPVREAVTAAGASACVSKWSIGDELLPTLRGLLTSEPDQPEEKTVVCIEDELDMIDLITLILERGNFKVIGALSGRQGLDVVRQVDPDVVLLDLMMPDMDGWEVARRMKADEVLRDVPLIAVTVVQRGSEKVMDLEVDDYVTKPFVPQDLLRRVREAARVVA